MNAQLDANPFPDFVNALARGLSVITAFSRERPDMTLSEVAALTGLTRAGARRFLLTLKALGYVRSDGRQFSLTAKVLELGYAYLASIDLPEIAEPFMEEVVRKAQESCSASVLDGGEIVYVARIPTSRIMSVSLNIGARLPAATTSMGRVLLAGLADEELQAFLKSWRPKRFTEQTVTEPGALLRLIQEAGRQGWAVVDQELETGLRSVAVPIRNRRRETVAAINISAHSNRATKRDMTRKFLPILQEAVAGIERNLV